MNVENTFWDLIMNVRKCLLGIGSTNDVLNNTKILIRLLQPYNEVERQTFLDKHYEQLLKIKYFLSQQRNTDARSLHDKLFTNILQVPKNPPLRLTKIFEDFVKGVTYFKTENTNGEQPIYHRLTSCGPGTIAFRIKYNQCKNLEKRDKRIAKERIQTCYIERLIYDKLYKQQTLFFPETGTSESSQNAGHVNWLKQTRDDFKTCFPNIEIEVELTEFDGLMPTKLTIKRCKKNGKCSTEIYKKEVIHGELKRYDDIVECFRFVNDIKKVKVQRFEKEEKWQVQDLLHSGK